MPKWALLILLIPSGTRHDSSGVWDSMSVLSIIRPTKTELFKRIFNKQSVMLSVCTHRNIDVDTLTNVMGLFGSQRHSINWCPVRGDAMIARARSLVASYFLIQSKEDIFFFLDDDVIFKPEDFTKIVDDIADGRDIVAGMYVQKREGAPKNCVLKAGDSMVFSKDETPQEVQCANTGFMGIHRRVFEKMAQEGNRLPEPMSVHYCEDLKFFPFFNPFQHRLQSGKYTYLSEDWAFCTRARALGFKVHIDPSIFLGHKGEYVYDLADRFREKKREITDGFTVTIS